MNLSYLSEQLLSHSLAESSASEMLHGSPTRLKDGSWGARVVGRAKKGDLVEIKTMGGKRFTKVIERVLWHGKDGYTGQMVSLCSLGDHSANPQGGGGSPRMSQTFCSNCEREARRLVPCVDSSGLRGMCCPSCSKLGRFERSFA